MKLFKISKKSFLVLPIALVSLELYLGIIIGYFCGKFFAGKYDGYQRIKSVFLNLGQYRLHLHHWLISLVLLVFGSVYNLFPIFPQFCFAFLGGLIIQDLYLDGNWRRVIFRR